MKPRANFWIEEEDEVVLSTWRIALLQAIADTGSISAGAEKMRVPYRVAWQKVHEMERRLGKPLLDTHTGGAGGGGAQLTPAGERYVRQFREFTGGLNELVMQRYRDVFTED